MAQEMERKFLVRSHGWRKRARNGENYRQGYLSTDPERTVRIRAGEKKAAITIKGASSGGNGLDRAEFEYPIPLEDANKLLDNLCLHPLIEKTRFRLPQNGNVWEIDEFDKENAGLVLAELEAKNGKPPQHLPGWVGEEVSNDDRFNNAHLVEHPYAEWRGRAPEPHTKYHWKPNETASEGLQRIVSEQLQAAIWQLSERASERRSLHGAVHEARKSLKKTRSAMRLLRGMLGSEYEKAYRRENSALGDAGRKLSPLRDAQALIETFDVLNDKYRDHFGDRSLASVRDGLVKRSQALRREFERRRTRGNVLKAVRDSAARIEKWKLQKGNSDLLSEGFANTIRRNHRACDEAWADASPEAFHEWRKRTKDLRYHFSLLEKAWPAVFDGYKQAAKDLEHKLGDDHNLAVLRETILKKPESFGEEEDVKAIVDIIDTHQAKLRAECKMQAARLYVDKPRQWRKRLERYWSAAQGGD